MESPLLNDEQEVASNNTENIGSTFVSDKLLIDSPDRELVFMGENSASIKDRTIYLIDEIDQDSYYRFVQALDLLNRTEGPIKFIINTPGGDVDFEFSIYDLIRTSKNPIYTIGTGSVCSAGVLLLACGNKRFVLENTTIMAHQSSIEIEGRFDEVESRFKWTKWAEQLWPELMARHTPQDASFWRKLIKKEAEAWYLGGQAIVDVGIADYVIAGPIDAFIKSKTNG